MDATQAALLNEVLYPASVTGGFKPTISVTSKQVNAFPIIRTDNNGLLTCTFPLSVSFLIHKNTAPGITAESPVHVSLGPPSLPTMDSGIPEVLTLAKLEFSKWKNVIAVRMGYVFKDGWITKERAVVVTVEKRKSVYDLQKEGIPPLPDYFMNYPVEVTGPTAEELIALHYGQNRLESLLDPIGIKREEIKYVPPPDVQLKSVRKKMNVIAHVSPEEGWKNLKAFLVNTQKTLTVAMYDFGARHILEIIDSLAKKNTFEDLTLAIQAGESVGEGTKANDLRDEEVVNYLKKKFSTRFHSAWISTGSVNGWVASSYHIKTAVRDHRSIWLSSGNWQSSNQPQMEKLDDISPSFLLHTFNREWHVIVDNEELAQTYERFIQNDYEQNKKYKQPAEEVLDNLNVLIPVNALELSNDIPPAYEIFKPFAENRMFTVMPLLTPDNFHEEVLTLITSAENELLIQNQTFNAPNTGQHKLEQLVQAVLKKQQEGVEVKIIFRIINAASARKNLEKLIDMGFDKNKIKLQRNCHNKGIIVDKTKVLIGSQNWSNDGVSLNRDASLIFNDEKLATYFRTIFLHDWNKLARHYIGLESYSIELAKDHVTIPKGMELMTWREVRELL
jgi:hypothetical protein